MNRFDREAFKLGAQPLIPRNQIDQRVVELAGQIGHEYRGLEVVAVAILKGSVFFATDLIQLIEIPVVLEFIRAKSYAGMSSTGAVQLTFGPERPVTGRHVILVEDVLDTGRTSAAVLDHLLSERPESVAICTLLDKPSQRTFEIHADYVGFTIGDEFVVGYGLDYEERFRNLRDIYALEAVDDRA